MRTLKKQRILFIATMIALAVLLTVARADFTAPGGLAPSTGAGAGVFALWQADGDYTGGRFGGSVSGGRDLTGDGVGDIITGAPFASPGGLDEAGAVYIYSGADGSLVRSFEGSEAGGRFGNAVSATGDIDGDGRDDMIIGAPRESAGGLDMAGAVYVISGADGTTIYKKEGTEFAMLFGNSAASAGDVNDDGRDDFIVGAHRPEAGGFDEAGIAYVYSGLDGSLLYQAAGSAQRDFFGYAVSAAGDVNADGYDDFIVGAYLEDTAAGADSGAAYVFSGVDGSVLYRVAGESADDWFGRSVSAAGDADADGYADFAIGAHRYDTDEEINAGAVYIYSGLDGSLLYMVEGEAAGDELGYSVAPAGDFDGDGYDDVISGAHRTDPGGLREAGSVYVISGANGEVLCRKDGASTGGFFSNSISAAGFLNADNRPEIVAGAWQASPAGYTQAGSVFLMASDHETPLIVNNHFNDTEWHETNPGPVYDVDFYKRGDAALDRFEIMSCSRSEACGDFHDWQVVAENIDADFFTGDWAIPDSFWDELPGGPNYITVRLYDDAGNFAQEGPAFHVNKGGVPPVYSGARGVLGCGPGCLEVYWDAGFDNWTGIESYKIYMDTSPGFTPSDANLAASAPGDATSFSLDWLADGQDYYFIVRASNYEGYTDYNTVEVHRLCGGDFAGGLEVPAGDTPGSNIDAGTFVKWAAGGVRSGEELGTSLANAGDVNGDGRDDFIAGAPLSDPAGLEDAGSILVYSGADGSLLYRKEGYQAQDWLGISVDGAGDVNGDGYDDFIAGAYRYNNGDVEGAGAAYVFSGIDGTVLYSYVSADTYDYYGFSVSGAGDVDADGYADYIIGAYREDPGDIWNAGMAYVYSGASGEVLHTVAGSGEGDYLGYSVSGAGDVNGDGRDDFIAGAFRNDTNATDAGAAFVYSGADASVLYEYYGTEIEDWLGRTVAGLGDINHDGYGDFAITAYRADVDDMMNAGIIFVYSGADGELLYELHGEAAGDELGIAVGSAGDVDGDGTDDIVAGAHRTDPDGNKQTGTVYVFSGADGSMLNRINGAAAGDFFGNAVASAGDFDADGDSDIIAAAWHASHGGVSDSGAIYVFATDMAAPYIEDNQDGDETVYYSDPGAVFDVDFFDKGSAGLASAEYAVTSENGLAGDVLIDWTHVAVNIGGESFTDNWPVDYDALPEGKSYVSVRAADAAGNTSPVATDVFYVRKSTRPPATPPAFDGITGITTCGSGCLELAWNAASDTEGETPIVYNIYMAETPGGIDFATPSFTTEAAGVQLQGLENGRAYYFTVRAQDSNGAEDDNTVIESGIPLDIIPEESCVTGAEFAPAVTLTWDMPRNHTHSANNNGRFTIFRAPDEDGEYEEVGEEPGPPYDNTLICPNSDYFYKTTPGNTANTPAADRLLEKFGPLMIFKRSDDTDTVQLSWELNTPDFLRRLKHYSITLVNLETGERTDMRENAGYVIKRASACSGQVDLRVEVSRNTGRLWRFLVRRGWNLIGAPSGRARDRFMARLMEKLEQRQLFELTAGGYIPVDISEVRKGCAYWVYADKEFELEFDGDGMEDGATETELNKGWNFVSNPFTFDIDWDRDVKVLHGNRRFTIDEAEKEGLIHKQLVEREDGQYRKINKRNRLAPWKGFMIRAEKKCRLVFEG